MLEMRRPEMKNAYVGSKGTYVYAGSGVGVWIVQ